MIVAVTLALLTLVAGQPSISAQAHREAAPAALASGVQASISPGGLRATVSGAQLDFWFVKALPLNAASTTTSWAAVEEGTLLGAVRLASEFRDIRGRLIKPGVYTLRYGIQPQNGDHLGVSPFREFVLLSPSAVDTDVAARGHEPTIEMSIKTAGGSHPAVWSIDPPVATEAALANHTTELGHQALVVEIPVSRGVQAAGTLRFGIVLIGRVDA